jgi:hypothetical protein
MANSNTDAYGAAPVRGNYTSDVDGHLWCANALAIMVANPSIALEELNDDAQEAIRYLLSTEIARAKHASVAGAKS